MGKLTTHVLDTARGQPAADMRLDLFARDARGATLLATLRTNAQGRTDRPLLDEAGMQRGEYELVFHVGDYFRGRGTETAQPAFLEQVPVRFSIGDPAAHYHVPLLCTPWSYATYRGS